MRVAFLLVLGLAISAHADPLRADPIEIKIAPASSTWKLTVPVDVVITATNITMQKRSMKIMSCSWDEHVRSSDAALAWNGFTCTKNGLTTVELGAGKSRTWTLRMFAKPDAKLGAHTFRLIMTPRDGDPLWSNLTTIAVAK